MDKQRILAFLLKLEELTTGDAHTIVRNVCLDSFLAARVINSKIPEGATKLLDEMVRDGLVVEETQYDRFVWSLPTSPAMGQKEVKRKRATPRRDKNIEVLLLTIDESPNKQLTGAEILVALRSRKDSPVDLKRRQVDRLIEEAEGLKVVEQLTRKAHNEARIFKLSRLGQSEVKSRRERQAAEANRV